MSGQFSLLLCFIEMPVIANSVDLDHMPRSAASSASDLGLHDLPMSHLWDARHKWVRERGHIGTAKITYKNSKECI